MMDILGFIADNTGIAIGILLAVIVMTAVIRTAIRLHRGEQIEITPVGIANDLPDSDTGMNRYSDALIADEREKER